MKRVWVIACSLGLLSSTVSARELLLPVEQWDDSTKVVLARAMVGEADWHRPDHVAIAWVLLRRWKLHQRTREPVSFKKFIRMYSSPLKTHSERSLWVQSLPWGPLPGFLAKRWKRVRKTATNWGKGRVGDPCPAALHWGGTMDHPLGHWSPVNCGRTRNIFYSVGKPPPRNQS